MRTTYNLNSNGSIESTIDSLANTIATHAPAGTTVKRIRAERGKSCKGSIIISTTAKSVETLPEGDYGPNSENARPNTPTIVKYAFYASTICPGKIGSVAIYSEDITRILTEIRRSGYLFGFRVVKATVEHGRRPFIDVTVAS